MGKHNMEAKMHRVRFDDPIVEGIASAFDVAAAPLHKVGDRVKVHRYGREYEAEVVRVGARGAAYARFVYANGAEREVRV